MHFLLNTFNVPFRAKLKVSKYDRSPEIQNFRTAQNHETKLRILITYE